MPALSAGDQTTWRTAPYSITTDVFVHAPTTVFAARVNQSSFTYPLTNITFDTVTTGAYTDIQEGQMLLIGSAAGKDDLGRTRVRKTNGGTIASSTVLYIQRSSNGTSDGEVNPSDNAYLTVINLRRPWSIAPYIDDDAVTFIDTDKSFTLNKSYPPVANGDPDVLKVVRDGSSSVDITFGNVVAFRTNPDATSSLTHAWTFHSTCTPTSSTSATVTVTVPVNTVFYAKHTVTDSVGTTYTHYSLVAVVTPTHANLRPCRITSHTARADGQQVQLEFTSDLPYTTYPDGTEVLIAKNERFGGTLANLAGVTDRKHMLFAGWIYEEETEVRATEYGISGRTTVTCYDAANWLNVLPGFPTVVEREGSPTRWEHMKEANITRYLHRILWAYSNILTRCCFTDSTAGAYAFPTLGSDGMSLYEQADQRAQAVANKLTCDKHNRLVMKYDPALMDTVSRTTTVIVPIEERDWRMYRYRFTRPPRTHWNWGEAIGSMAVDAADIGEVTTYFCVAPGEAPGQGLGNQSTGQQLVISQLELNVREGHRYATRMNNQYGYIEVTLRGGDAGIEPALMEWVQFEVTANSAGPRGRTISKTTERFLPIEVSYDYNVEGSIRVARVTLEKEVQGQAAATYYPPQDAYNPTPFPPNPYPDVPIQFPDDTYPDDYWLRGGLNRIALICTNGLARTTTFRNGDATVWDYKSWTDFGAGLSAILFTPDAFTYTGGGVKGWVCYGNDRVYYVDIAARTWTLKDTFSTGGGLNIDSSMLAQNFVVFARTEAFGANTRVSVTTDNTTWNQSNLTTAGPLSSRSASACFVSQRTAGKAWAQSRNTTWDYTSRVYVTTDYGANWAVETAVDLSQTTHDGGWDQIYSPRTSQNPSELIWFAGGGKYANAFVRVNNTTQTNIRPSYGGYNWVPGERRNGFSTAANDANRLLLAGTRWSGGGGGTLGGFQLFLTSTALGTPTWTPLTNSTGLDFGQCAISGDNSNIFYFWGGVNGSDAAIALSTNGGGSIASQVGNLSSFSPGKVVGIAGW